MDSDILCNEQGEGIVMFSVKIGTSNSNGNGSSNNLSDEHEVLNEYYSFVNTDSFYAAQWCNNIVVSAKSWNIAGAKEVKIDAVNQNVTTKNFVDVDINLQNSYRGVEVNVIDSKRGQIETGSGHDVVNVSALTNGGHWGELFTVDTGRGHDTIKFTNTSNSEFTQLNIDAGIGHDLIDISGLKANTNDASFRVLDGGNGNDLIIGSDGNETLIGGRGHDTIRAGAGNDQIDAGNGWDFINAGDGNDTIDAGNGSDTIYAGNGDDVISAGNGWDFISAGNGNDTIDAGNGQDIIYAGAGNDIIDGGRGHDYINAGSGNDTVVYDENDTIVIGGQGFDAIIVNTDEADIGYNYYGFEAILGQQGVEQEVETLLKDGLVVALGGDEGDELEFFHDRSFTLVDETLTTEMSDFISSQQIDVASLDAYQASTGQVIWTDVDLLA